MRLSTRPHDNHLGHQSRPLPLLARTRLSAAAKLALATGLTTIVMAATVSTAHAHYYEVLTSTKFQDVIDATDGYCSLAEAVQSINDNKTATGCTDWDTSNPGHITLLQAANKPYASYPYLLRNGIIAIRKSLRIQVSEEGFTAYVQSTGAVAFRVYSPADVTLYGLDITHTGTGSGRVVWNEGTLAMGRSAVRTGNVTTEPQGKGGGIYNKGTLWLNACQIWKNKGKKGGGIYNDGGSINISGSTISENTASAGGGIYNVNPAGGSNPPIDVDIYNSTITKNTAKAGGGVFTRGIVEFHDSFVTLNKAEAGASDEFCYNGLSCDGFGGGICSYMAGTSSYARIAFYGASEVSGNTAVTRGGAFYSSGQLNLISIKILNNTANRGGAIFASHSGFTHYCNVTAPETGPFSYVDDNKFWGVGGKNSIIDWDPGTAVCVFGSNPPRVEAHGNQTPTCAPGSASVCPQ